MNFYIIFNGKLLLGSISDEVKEKFARLEGLPRNITDQVFSGASYILKDDPKGKDISEYLPALERIGMKVQICDKRPNDAIDFLRMTPTTPTANHAEEPVQEAHTPFDPPVNNSVDVSDIDELVFASTESAVMPEMAYELEPKAVIEASSVEDSTPEINYTSKPTTELTPQPYIAAPVYVAPAASVAQKSSYDLWTTRKPNQDELEAKTPDTVGEQAKPAPRYYAAAPTATTLAYNNSFQNYEGRMNNVAGPDFEIGAVFGHTIEAYKKTFFKISFLTLLIYLPVTIFGLQGSVSLGYGLLTALITLVLYFLAQAMAVYFVFYTFKGEQASFGEAISKGLSRFFPLIVAAIIVAIGKSLGMLLLIIPGIIISCMWAVTIPACVVEKMGPLESISRSMELTKGHRVQIFGLFFVVQAFSSALEFVVELLSKFTGFGTLIVLPIHIIVYSFSTVMTTMMYYDLRVAKEGISIESLANVFE